MKGLYQLLTLLAIRRANETYYRRHTYGGQRSVLNARPSHGLKPREYYQRPNVPKSERVA